MKIIRFFVFIFLIAFLYGCPLYTGYPLGKPGKENIDGKLLGTWTNSEENPEVKKVKIDKSSKFEYAVKVLETGEHYYEETYDYKAWVTTFAGKNFLYLEPQGTTSKTYYYYAYEVNDKGFLSFEVNGELVHKEDLHSTDELRKLIADNIKTEGFLTSGVQWTKSK